jgi:hypothetical protein
MSPHVSFGLVRVSGTFKIGSESQVDSGQGVSEIIWEGTRCTELQTSRPLSRFQHIATQRVVGLRALRKTIKLVTETRYMPWRGLPHAIRKS